MARIDNVEIPSLLFDEQGADPATPASGFWRLYFKADGIYLINDAGTVVGPLGEGGGGGGGGDVSDDAYDASWNGETTTAPSQNAMYDKIQSFAGSSFPGSPADRQVFFRTDRDLHYFYDLANTRWLSIHEFVASFPATNLALTTGETGASNAGRIAVPFRDTYSILVTRFQVSTNVQTTNDGSKYWTIKLNRADGSDSDTQIGSTMNTSADTAGMWVDRFISPNTVVDSSARLLKLRVDKVSTPGGLLVTGLLHFRLVG